MEIQIPKYYFNRFDPDKFVTKSLGEMLSRDSHWGSNYFKVNLDLYTDEDIEYIISVCSEDKEMNPIKSLCQAYLQIKSKPDTTPVKRLVVLAAAIDRYLQKDLIRRWLFQQEKDSETMHAYLVTSVTYYPYDERRDEQAHVTIRGIYNGHKGGETVEIASILSDECDGSTVEEILKNHCLFHETPALIAMYDADFELFEQYRAMVNKQFLASAIDINSYTQLKGGRRVVNDESLIDRKPLLSSVPCNLTEAYPVPFHPYIYVYSLDDHDDGWVHVRAMTPYQYDASLRDKLVLPSCHRDLLDVLVNDEYVLTGDIIKGKAGGTTILCCGAPGLGKTLTAECYSEISQKPLYRISAAQLGTSASAVEDVLKKCLLRAERWGAIMLIDEADVYISKRGSDIVQNAIVAAFLRTLEYFNGILFLTTNLFENVDDAIISRCIATIKYEAPNAECRRSIWNILSTQLKVNLSEDVINRLTEIFPTVSGRDIKELLKLTGRYISAKSLSSDEDIIRAFISCAQFRAVECQL